MNSLGPWRLSKYLDENSRIVIDEQGFDVAAVYYPNRDANALLIAAAPTLLAVCEELAETAAYWFECDVPLGIVERLNAAIKAAKGKQ